MKFFVLLAVLLSVYYMVAMQVATDAVNSVAGIYQNAEAVATNIENQ